MKKIEVIKPKCSDEVLDLLKKQESHWKTIKCVVAGISWITVAIAVPLLMNHFSQIKSIDEAVAMTIICSIYALFIPAVIFCPPKNKNSERILND